MEQSATAGKLLKQGVTAFRAGDKTLARNLIAQAADLAPETELVWMWTASTARNRAEALDALDRVLDINPDNAKALEWLKRLRPSSPRPAAAGAPTPVVAPPIAKAVPAPVAEAPRTASPSKVAERASTAGDVEPGAQAANTLALAAAAEAPPTTTEPNPAEPPAAAEDADQMDAQPEASVANADDQAQEESTTPVEALAPVHQPLATVEDDPIRALLQRKADEDEAREEAFETSVEVEARQLPEESEEAETSEANALETAAAESDPAEETGGTAAEPNFRPISKQTCLLCGSQSLTDGACGYCRAVADISLLDEISRNENVDRTAMLAAVDRFRKELEAGPNFEANLGLALAYLNMKQSNDALPRLGEACRLQPDNADLRRFYEQLRARRLILVVDDSKTVQKMIAGVLEKELYRVMLADDGLQALARLDDETPSLILLDITMPRMDGYQVARIITGNDATASIPVVMLSGKDGFFDRIRGKLAGAKGYVTKPFDPSDLTETIKRCLEG